MPRPLPRPEWHTLDVAGAPMRCMTAGEGDPLLFLHGWGMTPRIYAPAVNRLCAAGIKVIAPALPGFGGSAKLPFSELTLSHYAERMAALLRVLDIDRPAFVMGHSFGGGVAIQLAYEHPGLVRSLTLLNSVGGAPGRPAARATAAEGMTSRPWWHWALGAATEASPLQVLRMRPSTLAAVITGVGRDLLPNLVRRPVTMTLTAMLALSADLADEARQLIESGMPVLFIWGDQDRLIAPGAFAEIANVLPPEIVKGRHGWLLTAPEEFGQLMHNALVVHALLERQRRGSAIVFPRGAVLAELFPPERRKRARAAPASQWRDDAG